jgi:3-hydroxyisobutyrate dehydrogenase-like beta-hydroxyacid dehydrogenase
MSDVPEQVGFVGLGQMGSRMAPLLVAAGYPVVVHDLDEERQAAFGRRYGCATASSPRDLSGARVVVTMLPDDRDVRRALSTGTAASHRRSDPGLSSST